MKLETIKFLASFGDVNKEVELVYMKVGDFQIIIDRRFYGHIVNYTTGWAVALHDERPPKDEYGRALPYTEDKFFTTDDKDAILQRAGVY